MRIVLLVVSLLATVVLRARAEEPAPAAGEQGYLGFQMRPVAELSPEQRDALGVGASQGVVVVAVGRGTPAEQAGLLPGDVVVRLAGRTLPDPAVLAEGDEAARQRWAAEMNAIGATIRAGARVEIAARRKGVETLLHAVAADLATMRRIAERAAADPAAAGEPRAQEEDFERTPEGSKVPPGFAADGGEWEVVEEPGSEGKNRVLRQSKTVETWTVGLLRGDGRAYRDATVSVRFLPVRGDLDASGGIVFRAKDAENYYLVRANSLERNLRIYKVVGGGRRQIAELEIEPPRRGAWHDLQVTFRGSSIRAVLDGTAEVSVEDDTYAHGWTGLWTKADAVTLFDDWKAVPAGP
jgi:hypothetical protein